jgi:hypothetical protein
MLRLTRILDGKSRRLPLDRLSPAARERLLLKLRALDALLAGETYRSIAQVLLAEDLEGRSWKTHDRASHVGGLFDISNTPIAEKPRGQPRVDSLILKHSLHDEKVDTFHIDYRSQERARARGPAIFINIKSGERGPVTSPLAL